MIRYIFEMLKVSLLSTFLTLCLISLPMQIRAEDCFARVHKILNKWPIPKFNEKEWLIWNPRFSDAEIARVRQDEVGSWGFARIREGIHRLHTHKEPEIYWIRQGSGIMQLGEEILNVQRGDKIIIPGNVAHSIKKDMNSDADLIFEYLFPKVRDFDNTVKYHWLDSSY